MQRQDDGREERAMLQHALCRDLFELQHLRIGTRPSIQLLEPHIVALRDYCDQLVVLFARGVRPMKSLATWPLSVSMVRLLLGRRSACGGALASFAALSRRSVPATACAATPALVRPLDIRHGAHRHISRMNKCFNYEIKLCNRAQLEVDPAPICCLEASWEVTVAAPKPFQAATPARTLVELPQVRQPQYK